MKKRPKRTSGNTGMNVRLTKSLYSDLSSKALIVIILSEITRPMVPISVAKNPLLMNVSFSLAGVTFDIKLVTTP
jgi:hypothetical protein